MEVVAVEEAEVVLLEEVVVEEVEEEAEAQEAVEEVEDLVAEVLVVVVDVALGEEAVADFKKSKSRL